MDPAYVVLLLAVTIAVVAIAGHLIAIVLILKHVVNRLNTILGAVQAVTTTAQPVEDLVGDINTDLDAGRKLMEDLVGRLEESRAPVGATAEPARHATDRHSSDGSGGGTATAAPPAAPGTQARPSEEWPPRESPSPSPPRSPRWNG
jgi:hypothetical protein